MGGHGWHVRWGRSEGWERGERGGGRGGGVSWHVRCS